MIAVVCTIPAKGQTTVPKAIRQALGVSYGGRIAFRVEEGNVSVHAADEPERDPAPARQTTGTLSAIDPRPVEHPRHDHRAQGRFPIPRRYMGGHHNRARAIDVDGA